MEKRNDGQGNAQDEISAGSNGVRKTCKEGVGGRQIAYFSSSGGGGYLDNYSFSQLSIGKFPPDPRLDDLKRLGIHHTWQKVAATIGMDAFLTMWRILDTEEQFQHPKGNLSINLRRYRSYVRFQRNEYIRSLAKEGFTKKEIANKLSSALCEKVQTCHMTAIIRNR